jgi:predicted RNA-binding protein associated with RNAse of E/G family
MSLITENKRHVDGRQELFQCEGLVVGARQAVIRFRHQQARTVSGFHLPAGSITYGFFWRGRHYILYRFVGPEGRLIAHRFDVVDEVRISRRRVEYLDLALDMWVGPDGRARLEDEEEVAEYAARGLLSAERLALIERTRRHLLTRRRRIIERAAALLAARI